MSRTDKDLSYELRLEDELRPKRDGTQTSTAHIYIHMISYRKEDSWTGVCGDAVLYRVMVDPVTKKERRFYYIAVKMLNDWQRSYGGKSIADHKNICRRAARHSMNQQVRESYDKYGWYDEDSVVEAPYWTRIPWWW